MNSAIIIMTILGCGQNEAACEYIRTAQATFASEAECWTRSEAELLKTDASGYPSVIATCEPLPEMTAGLPRPEASGPEAVGEPTIVYAREEVRERPNPLRWAIARTRQAAGGLKVAIAKTWRVITRSDRKDEEPVLLGRFVEADS